MRLILAVCLAVTLTLTYVRAADPYFTFFPAEVAILQPNGPALAWTGRCFANVSAELSGSSAAGGSVSFTLANRVALDCLEDFYLFGGRYAYHLKTFDFEGTHTVDITNWADGEWTDYSSHGMSVFLFPEAEVDVLASVGETAALFLPENPLMFDMNRQFLKDAMEYDLQPRGTTEITLNQSLIQSGDYFGVLRLDGLSPMISFGTGGHVSHTTIAMRFEDGSLHVCESTGADKMDPYWPPPYGIICTPFDQWIEQARTARYNLVYAPLSAQNRQLFNETAAREYIQSVLGSPYGIHNFIFTFVDTEFDNFPSPVTPRLLELVAGAFAREENETIYNFLIMGLNHRLNTNCNSIDCIFSKIDELNITLVSAMAIPEQDEWRYGGNVSLVCDTFVCSVYKAAGLFGSIADSIQCTEFTPKDVYQLNLFSNDPPQQACLEADPDLPYCIVIGPWKMSLPNWNTISPYAHMNERCPSLPPDYSRIPTNC